MIDVNQRRPTPFSGKKLFALTAVALMVVSCFVAVAAVDGSNEQLGLIDIKRNDDGTYSSNEFSIKGVAFDKSGTLTLTDATIDNSGFSYAVSISTNDFSVADDEPFKICVKGENTIHCNYKGDRNACIGSTVPLLIEGIDGGSLKLIDDEKVGWMFGIQTYQAPLTIKNLELDVMVGETTAMGYGIVTDYDLSIDNSDVTVSTSTAPNYGCSIGIKIESNTPTFSVANSKVTVSSAQYAMWYNDRGMPAKDIESSKIMASAESTGANPEEVTGITIDKNYKWVEITHKDYDAHTLHFDADGGTGAPADRQLIMRETYDLSQANPTKDGFILSGWMDGDGKSYATTDTFIMPDKGVTLTAQWGDPPVVKHKAIFDANGGTGSTEAIEKQAGEKYNLPESGFSRDGYTFGGWSIDGTTVIYKGTEMTMGNSDVTYKAVWNKVEVNMDVKTDSNGKAEVLIDPTIVKSLTVKNGNVSVFFDQASIEKIQGKTLYIEIRIVANASEDVYEIIVLVDGVSQRVVFDGEMKVTLPYDSSKGEPSVFIRGGSTDRPVDFHKEGSTVYFNATGACKCVVKYADAPGPAPTENEDYTILTVCIVAVVVIEILALVALVYFTLIKKP